MPDIQVHYFASARAAAGVESEPVSLPDGATLDDLVALLCERHPGKLTTVLTAVSFLLDGVATTKRSRALPDGTRVDVLPPFAGG